MPTDGQGAFDPTRRGAPPYAVAMEQLAGRTATAVARGEARRRAIVEAAMTLFATRGVHATTLAEIGARAGIKRPALLHHFASKEALVHAVLDEHERRFRPTQRSIAAHRGLDAITRLVEIAEFEAVNRERVALWTMLLTDAVSADSVLGRRMRTHYETFRWAVNKMLAEAEEDGELRPGVDQAMQANMIIAFFNGIETSWLLDPSLPLVETVKAHLATVVADLRR
jgi:AcrR family transcriptional regulator